MAPEALERHRQIELRIGVARIEVFDGGRLRLGLGSLPAPRLLRLRRRLRRIGCRRCIRRRGGGSQILGHPQVRDGQRQAYEPGQCEATLHGRTPSLEWTLGAREMFADEVGQITRPFRTRQSER